MMGLEEHLIGMFRGDSEFHEDAAPSHLGGAYRAPAATAAAAAAAAAADAPGEAIAPTAPVAVAKATPLEQGAPHETQAVSATDPAASAWIATWATEAERELKKIPFFVRGKARRNTELYARERGLSPITLDTLYDAKAHYSR
jgi:light-independent protochlorophyllide reductase subunit B